MDDQNNRPEPEGRENEPLNTDPQNQSSRKQVNSTERKVIFSLCYLFGILFFLPLIMYSANDAEAKAHANQGLTLLLLSLIGNVIFGVLTLIGGVFGALFGIIASLYSAAIFVVCIVAVVWVVTDRRESLPIIGQIRFIK